MTAALDGLRELGRHRPVPRDRLAVHATDAAVALLGCLLIREHDGSEVVARVVETEAYREDDPASHSYAQRTRRTEPMFWAPGTAYVYRSYGVHWCLNVSVEADGVGAAVLLRAAVVLRGADAVRAQRPTARRDRDLLRGPGNLARGLAVDAPTHDRGDLLRGHAGLRLAEDGWRPPAALVASGPRVGVRLAPDVPWRTWVRGTPEVSRYTRSPRAAPPPVAPPA
ncbi:DNA-3-methyladenine glycosylase [Nitriliruptoraceae bacterium ZYF776]|nr:DNA-3-methyladenine glycosylase [Profundirhabdus halotolerans]